MICRSTYTCQHALALSNGAAAPEEPDDHYQTANSYQNIGPGVDEAQAVVCIGVLGEVITDQQPDAYAEHSTS